MKRITQVWLALGFLLAWSSTAPAQFGFAGDGNTIAGTGLSEIKQPPEILRLQVEMSVKAKTLKDALAKLQTQRETAVAQLTKLEAQKDSIKAGDAKVNTTISNRQRQIDMMVRQRMRQGGKKSKKATEKPIVVTSQLTAEWKLKGKDNDSLLLEAQAIEDKVREADLLKNSEEQTAEDEELAEEMDGAMDMYEDGQPKPGEPMFLYVTHVSNDQWNKALSTAFASARTRAKDLAAAAGADIGALRGLTTQQNTNDQFSGGFNAFGQDFRRQYLMQLRSQRAELGDDAPREAIGVQPSEVSLPVTVYATFSLETKSQ